MAQTYTVKAGDTLSKIATQQGIKVSDITGYKSGDPNLIYPGEVLTIGVAAPVTSKAFNPAQYATTQGYSKYYQYGGVWYGNVAGAWKTFSSKEAAQSANLAPAAPVAPTAPTAPTAPVAPTTPVVPAVAPITAPTTYTGVSIVDYLKSVGQASDYSSRATLAQQYGISNYTGTSAQNTQLLNLLKGGATLTPTTTPPPPPIITPEEQARKDAADLANKNAQNIFDNLPGDEVNMRDSTKLLEDIQEKMEEAGGEIPKPVSLVDLFAQEKTKLGIEPLETELSGIDSDIERIQTELLVQAEEAGEKLVSTREIGRAKGALQKRAEREIALLNVERSAVARILENKISTLNTIVSLTDMDYDNASDYYTKEYNRQVQLYDLVSGAEERELTHAERAKNDAQANLTIIQNAFKDGNLTYNSLTADQKLKISQLEAQAGFPSGLTAQIMADDPDKKIQTVVSRTDESGNEYFDVLLVDKNNAMSVNTIFRGKSAPKAPTTREAEEAELSSIEKTLFGTRGTDGYVDPKVYQSLKAKATIGPDDFDKRFSHLLSPQEKTKLGIKVVSGEEMDPVLLKDLQDAIWAIDQNADEDEVKRKFLEKHPKEESLFSDYVGL